MSVSNMKSERNTGVQSDVYRSFSIRLTICLHPVIKYDFFCIQHPLMQLFIMKSFYSVLSSSKDQIERQPSPPRTVCASRG